MYFIVFEDVIRFHPFFTDPYNDADSTSKFCYFDMTPNAGESKKSLYRRHTTSLQQMNWHQGMWVDLHFIIMPSFFFFFWETLIGKGKTIALNKHLLLQKFDL